GGRGRFIVSGSRDKTVKLWNASVGLCLMTFVSTRAMPRRVLGRGTARRVWSCA
ncbi:unnamed protein product, partial [Scytosiphon promiscuus]